MMPYIVVAVLVLASLATGTTQASYGRLNSYLIARVNDDDVGSNIEAASRWLKEQSGRRLPFLSPAPVPDLEKFTALKRVIDDTKCDQAAYEIMRANEDAVGLNKLVTNEKVTRRVDKVMLEIFKNHAERCSTNYPIIWREKKDRLDSKVAERVANLARVLIERDKWLFPEDVSRQSQSLFSGYIRKPVPIARYLGSDIFKVALVSNAENDPDFNYLRKIHDYRSRKDVVRKDKVKELVQRNMVEPCKLYGAHFGPDLFIPAKFEAKYHNKVDDTNPNFYLDWSYFTICQALTENSEVVIQDIIETIADEW